MSSGLRKASAQRNSSKSLGSFVEVHSSSSSDFEPVDLEDMDSHSGGEGEAKSSVQTAVMGKNATPPAAAVPPLRTVPEQTEIRPEAGAEGSQFAEPLQEGLQNLENATHKAAELAKDFTNKLITSGAAEARSSVMKLAGDVSSWWAALDPGAATQPQETSEQSGRSPQGSGEVQQLFGLPESEELMEKFTCTLLQSFECPHNTFSKPQQVRCPGRLFITDKNSCFNADKIRFAILHKDVKSIGRLQEPGKALRLDFGTSGEHAIFTDFMFSDLDSALGLLEHLTS